MKRHGWLLLAALGACAPVVVSPTTDAAPDAAAEAPDAAPEAGPDAAPDAAPEVAACLAAGASCRGAALRCCAGYCDYDPYGYGSTSGRCVVPLEAGEYCTESRRCASGRCVDELCRASSCAATGAQCYADEACCAGFCTASATSYAPGRCVVAQAVGAYCEGPRWCLTGRCVDSLCAR
jgi:hypothetical protein